MLEEKLDEELRTRPSKCYFVVDWWNEGFPYDDMVQQTEILEWLKPKSKISQKEIEELLSSSSDLEVEARRYYEGARALIEGEYAPYVDILKELNEIDLAIKRRERPEEVKRMIFRFPAHLEMREDPNNKKEVIKSEYKSIVSYPMLKAYIDAQSKDDLLDFTLEEIFKEIQDELRNHLIEECKKSGRDPSDLAEEIPYVSGDKEAIPRYENVHKLLNRRSKEKIFYLGNRPSVINYGPRSDNMKRAYSEILELIKLILEDGRMDISIRVGTNWLQPVSNK